MAESSHNKSYHNKYHYNKPGTAGRAYNILRIKGSNHSEGLLGSKLDLLCQKHPHEIITRTLNDMTLQGSHGEGTAVWSN